MQVTKVWIFNMNGTLVDRLKYIMFADTEEITAL